MNGFSYVVTLDAGQAWRALPLWRRAFIRVFASDLAAAASREANQARDLGLPVPAPQIQGRASTLGNDWLGRH